MIGAQERKERADRLYEDVRRAMNGRDFDRAARLSAELSAMLAGDQWLLMQTWPVCLECNGYAEVVDPEHPERKTGCASAPATCLGTQGGRMTPEQHRAYLDAKLSPRRPTRTEAVQAPEVKGGPVPRLPADEDAPKDRPFGTSTP